MFRSALVGPTTTVPHILISIFKYNVVRFVKPEAGYIFCTKFFNTSCYFSGIKIILYLWPTDKWKLKLWFDQPGWSKSHFGILNYDQSS